VRLSTAYASVNIASVKKDFGEHFLALLTTRQLLTRAGVTSYDEKTDDFLHIVFALRVAKNFQALK
jgi:hypothetical protein